MTACRCTHEQGDTDCEKHPCCPNCGESVESMRLVADYRAVEAALNAANVPTTLDAMNGNAYQLNLETRVRMLATSRDEARRLAEQGARDRTKLTHDVSDCAHALSNEKQVTADLRDAMHTASERLVFALWIHAAYRVDGRGPTGCIMDALDSIAPDVTASIRSGLDGHDTYAKHFGSEDDPQCEAPVSVEPRTTPLDEMLANLVGELHAHRNAPTDVQGIASTVERLIGMTHALAIAANSTLARVWKLERVSAKETP